MWRLIGEACLLITRSTLTVRRNILDRFDKNIQVSIDDKKVFNACSKNCDGEGGGMKFGEKSRSLSS